MCSFLQLRVCRSAVVMCWSKVAFAEILEFIQFFSHSDRSFKLLKANTSYTFATTGQCQRARKVSHTYQKDKMALKETHRWTNVRNQYYAAFAGTVFVCLSLLNLNCVVCDVNIFSQICFDELRAKTKNFIQDSSSGTFRKRTIISRRLELKLETLVCLYDQPSYDKRHVI